jgi:hypothetical protein
MAQESQRTSSLCCNLAVHTFEPPRCQSRTRLDDPPRQEITSEDNRAQNSEDGARRVHGRTVLVFSAESTGQSNRLRPAVAQGVTEATSQSVDASSRGA